MKKLCFLLFCSFFMTMNSFADNPDRIRIFYFNSDEIPDHSFLVYNDETYIGSDYLHRDSIYFPTLIPGKTYLLKVTCNYTDIDSCFVSYDYVSQSYEIDGFWTYANTGSLVEPSGMYGFYNTDHDDIINYEDYPDPTYEELEFLNLISGFYFHYVSSYVSTIKIEIYEYLDE